MSTQRPGTVQPRCKLIEGLLTNEDRTRRNDSSYGLCSLDWHAGVARATAGGRHAGNMHVVLDAKRQAEER